MNICKRLNGNHSRMTGTIEGIQMYSKMHRLFQNSMLFLHCVPKNVFQNGTTNRTKRYGRSYGNTTETTETNRKIGSITIAWIASSSIRTTGAIVKICKRLNGNHSRMTRTIEAIQTYPKMHRLFQDSRLFLHCVPKHAFQNGTTNTREWRRSSYTSGRYSKR